MIDTVELEIDPKLYRYYQAVISRLSYEALVLLDSESCTICGSPTLLADISHEVFLTISHPMTGGRHVLGDGIT